MAYERARGKVGALHRREQPKEMVFTRNTTEAINLVARAWGDANLRAGDRILLSVMEHHSNLVPWQMLAAAHRRAARLPADRRRRAAGAGRPRHAADRAHQAGGDHAPIECAGHDQPGARDRGAGARGRRAGAGGWRAERAAYAGGCAGRWGPTSWPSAGHKMCGPTGIGALWGRRELLEAMPPFLGGGSMIKTVDAARDDLRRSAGALRGRHAGDRRGDRAWARRSIS